ncbi:MAG: GNAT family N-acetyltransferase [bacterium]
MTATLDDPAIKIRVTITFLETSKKPARAPRKIHAENVLIMRALQPTVSFYRFLYNTVGQPWLWYERRQMGDEALQQIIQHPQVEVYVLYAGGVPAGYAELDWRQTPEVELAYFGLMPEFIGKGLGTLLIDEMHEQVWMRQPQRFWLHTCTLDHPQALAFYQRAGFVPYKQEVKIIDDPRILGLM